MKKAVFISMLMLSFTLSVYAQRAGGTGEGTSEETKITITVGSKVFSAIMYDNATARAFVAKLPLTLNMNEYNSNEKYFNLPENFLFDSPSPAGTIREGELMCWRSNVIVLFYDTFSSRNSYVRLGRIEDVSGLAAALGRGGVTVTFALD
jgi:hypothetical protein